MRRTLPRLLLVCALLFLIAYDGDEESGRVLILGIDGLDPQTVDLLMVEGRMPNFARLRQEGAYGKVICPEPLLSPIVEDVLRDATARDFDITFATNILDESLHKFRDILAILDDPRHGFQFSFDSVAQLEMNHIRGKEVYEQVVANARKIARLRGDHGYRARLFAQIVLQELNIDSLFSTIDFLIESIGVDVCIVQPEVKYADVTFRTLRNQRPLEYSPEFRAKLLETVRRLFTVASDDGRIKVEGGSYADWEKFMTKPQSIKGPCNSRNMIMAGPYGDLRGCLFSPVLGNIRRTGLLEYLQSRPYQEYLKLARVCKICINGCA